MRRVRIAVIFVFVMAVVQGVPGHLRAETAGTIDDVRVYAIQPACFEYMFTSVMNKPDGKPLLSFNHVNGRTFFAAPGDQLGDYTVKSFEPSAERIFNPSVNSYMEKKAGRVVLESTERKAISLEMGKILPQPGYMACLIWRETGNWMHVEENDAVPDGEGEIAVTSITEDAVTLSRTNTSYTVPLISEKDAKDLVQLWERRKKDREQVAQQVEKEKEKEETSQQPRVVTQVIRHAPPLEAPSLQPSRSLIAVTTPPQFFFGTEYRYPVSFETVPLVMRGPSGTWVRNAMVVPKRFETYYSGFGMRVHEKKANVVCPVPGK
jgi:hypothetical protein